MFRVTPHRAIGFVLCFGLILLSFSGCSYLREQAYQRLDQEHAAQVSQALDALQEATQLLQAGSFTEALAKAKIVQASLQSALQSGQEALPLAKQLYDEWVTTFLRDRQELEQLYLDLAQALGGMADAMKSGDWRLAQTHLATVTQMKDRAGAVLGRIEELQKLQQASAQFLVPRINVPTNFNQPGLKLSQPGLKTNK